MGLRVDIAAIGVLLGLLALGWMMLRKRKAYEQPHIAFPTLQNFPKDTPRSSFASLPPYLYLASLALFALAFIDPHTMAQNPTQLENALAVPRQGIAIYFVLDQSGSMREQVPVPSDIDPSRQLSKIELLKKVTSLFISGDKAEGLPGLQGDLVGAVAFSRGAHVLAPLTLDHQVVLDDIAEIQLSHTQDTDGTAIGYAIYKTASMIAATRHYAQEMQATGQTPYQIKGSAIIVVTDGLQEPSPLDKGKRLRNMDIPEAAAYAKEQNIRVYIINVDPSITSEEFTPHRHVMEKATEMTGGKFIIVGGGTSLMSVYEGIARLEKGNISGNQGKMQLGMHRSFSLYPWLIALGLFCLSLGVLLETLLLRRVP